jgi:hypothetical protein
MTTAINQTYGTDEFTELRVKVAFSELVTYEADRTFEIPIAIAHSPRAVRQFIADELDPMISPMTAPMRTPPAARTAASTKSRSCRPQPITGAPTASVRSPSTDTCASSGGR